MKFILLMYSKPAETKAMSTSDLEAVMRKHEALRAELTASGELINGAGLAYPESTTNVHWRDRAPAVFTEGPLVDGEEHMTAYYTFECADRDRALAIAERLLDSHVTTVEVREIHDSTGFP